MPDPINYIDALLQELRDAHADGYTLAGSQYAALSALVAERNALKQRVAALNSENVKLHWEMEENPPADRDRELRERLVCAALTGVIAGNYGSEYESAAIYAIRHADAVLAAMRKEGGGA
jgi:chorismate mutase